MVSNNLKLSHMHMLNDGKHKEKQNIINIIIKKTSNSFFVLYVKIKLKKSFIELTQFLPFLLPLSLHFLSKI